MNKRFLVFLGTVLVGCFAFVEAHACAPGEVKVIEDGQVICLKKHDYYRRRVQQPPQLELPRAAPDAAPGFGGETRPLTPVREYLRARDIPPADAGAYGIVVLQSKMTSANRAKLKMVCDSYVAFFPTSESSTVPISDQMITIWPIDDPDADEAKADNCDFVLKHYDLNAAESAINDAKAQHAAFDGEGPYLVGWSPSNSRGLPDKVVLVIDMSDDTTQPMIDDKFRFWKTQIVNDPSTWRGGWSLEGVRLAIKGFANKYGPSWLTAVKLVGGKD